MGAESSRWRVARNPSSGRSRNWPATLIRPAGNVSSDGICPAPVNIASIVWSSCSLSGRSGIGALHLSPQALNCTKLKLLYGALTPPELLCNFADALLLDKTHVNHAVLRIRKPFHQLEQYGA